MKKKLAVATALISVLYLSTYKPKAQVGAVGPGGTASAGSSSAGGGGASTTATYVVKTSEPTLTNSYPIVNGVRTASNPLLFTQTFNNAVVNFEFVKIVGTNTASDTDSSYLKVIGGTLGTSNLFCVGPCDDIYPLKVSLGTVTSSVDFAVQGQFTLADGRYNQTQSRTYWHAPTAYDFAIGSNSSANSEYIIKVGDLPTLTSGWGTGATRVGNNAVGRVTIGTTPGTDVVLTFSQAYTTNAPVCQATNETTAALVIVKTVTTAAVTFTGTFSNGDKVSYHCVGFAPQ